ncbi:MAG: hypothetical protein RR945_03520 [Erysipelotrichaceae bacterium]
MSKKEITKECLEEILRTSFYQLYNYDHYLIFQDHVNGKNHVSERAIVFRFAHYLQNIITRKNILHELSIDCEYNRNGYDPKYISGFGNAIPDLIIHKRGSNKKNFLIMEFKTYWNQNNVNDIAKIQGFMDQSGKYKYKYGIFFFLGESTKESYMDMYHENKCNHICFTNRSSFYYNEGEINQNVAFVFSCPGEKELLLGKPVAGRTGENLNLLLELLNKKNGTVFPSTDRYSYLITNASSEIHYKAYDGHSEPTQTEITQEENLNRLKADLLNKEFVITFGKKAKFAVSQLTINSRITDRIIINVPHLSMQSLNRLSLAESLNKYEGHKKIELKIEEIAEQICEQISNL